MGRSSGAVRFALTSILSQGERKWPPSATPPPLWIPAPYRGTGHAFDRGNDECEGIPTDAGMTSARGFRLSFPARRGMRPELWLGTTIGTADSAIPSVAPPRPQRGTSPRATFAVRFALTSILSQGERNRPPLCNPWLVGSSRPVLRGTGRCSAPARSGFDLAGMTSARGFRRTPGMTSARGFRPSPE